MSIFTLFEQKIKKSIQSIDLENKSDLNLDRITVELPRDPSHGDLATNAAMVLAKQVGTNPRQLADVIVAELVKDEDVASAVVAGPGFINIVAKPSFGLDNWRLSSKNKVNLVVQQLETAKKSM